MLQINGRSLDLPLIQGGMGVGVSLGSLAGSVAACGALGVISSVNAGYREADFWQRPDAANLRALKAEIAKARQISRGRGLLGVNVMVATRQYAEAVRCAADAGIDAVICGAGLPLDLPELVGDRPVLIAPIVSGGKAARTICRLWDRRYHRTPDFVVLEGPEAGGHLGFGREALLAHNCPTLCELLPQVKAELAPFERQYGKRIPVFAAGGIFDGADAAAARNAGADGVQAATRFIATPECDASDEYKRILLAARAEDVRIVQSPVGMPGRALNSPLLAELAEKKRIAPEGCVGCVSACDPFTTPYCITAALLAAVRGDWQRGLFFCGSNIGRINKMQTVAEVIADLCRER